MESHLDILLVDDDLTDLGLFRMGVDRTELNIRLQSLSAGQQAIDYLEAKGAYADRSVHPLPDVIVLDLKMPKVSGFDFLAWRKHSPLFSSIPVVVLSGSTDAAEAKIIIQLGANKHITKPGDVEGWKQVVREIWDFGTQSTAFLRAEKARPTTK